MVIRLSQDAQAKCSSEKERVISNLAGYSFFYKNNTTLSSLFGIKTNLTTNRLKTFFIMWSLDRILVDAYTFLVNIPIIVIIILGLLGVFDKNENEKS